MHYSNLKKNKNLLSEFKSKTLLYFYTLGNAKKNNWRANFFRKFSLPLSPTFVRRGRVLRNDQSGAHVKDLSFESSFNFLSLLKSIKGVIKNSLVIKELRHMRTCTDMFLFLRKDGGKGSFEISRCVMYLNR